MSGEAGDMLSMQLVRDREDRAWLAGFIDGEGSIGITRTSDHRRPGTHGYRASLQIGNTDRASLVRALQIMGISHPITELAPQTERHAAQYHINVRDQAEVSVTLARLLPYLVIKRRQAQIVMAFCRRRLGHQGRGRHAPYSAQEHEDYMQLRALNKRGPK